MNGETKYYFEHLNNIKFIKTLADSLAISIDFNISNPGKIYINPKRLSDKQIDDINSIKKSTILVNILSKIIMIFS